MKRGRILKHPSEFRRYLRPILEIPGDHDWIKSKSLFKHLNELSEPAIEVISRAMDKKRKMATLTIRINLDQSFDFIREEFSSLLRALGKHRTHYSKDEDLWDHLLTTYILRKEDPKKWTFRKIGMKIFGEEKSPKSTEKKAQQYFREAQTLFEG